MWRDPHFCWPLPSSSHITLALTPKAWLRMFSPSEVCGGPQSRPYPRPPASASHPRPAQVFGRRGPAEVETRTRKGSRIRQCNEDLIIDPASMGRFIWDAFTMLLILFISFELPYASSAPNPNPKP